MRIDPRLSFQPLTELQQELDKMRAGVVARADRLSLNRDAAELELTWPKAIEVRDLDSAFIIEAVISGVDLEYLELKLAPHDLLIQILMPSGEKMSRAIHFDRAVDIDKAHVQLRTPLLTMTFPYAS